MQSMFLWAPSVRAAHTVIDLVWIYPSEVEVNIGKECLKSECLLKRKKAQKCCGEFPGSRVLALYVKKTKSEGAGIYCGR